MNKNKLKCYQCGNASHLANVCRFINVTCNLCRKKGHLSKVSVKMLQTYLSIYKETPWDAFKISIAEICYKNHLTDERDVRLLMTYYKQCFCDEVCSNTKFQLTDLEYYYIPEDGPFENYVEYIKTLPLLEEAEVFGQHPNSEILYRIQEGESLLKNLGKFLGDTLKYKEENLENQVIKIIEDLNQEIPSKINEEEAENVLDEKPEPYSYVLVQETKRHNILVDYVKKSLEILKDSVTGKQKMTERAEHMMKFIQKMEVPPEWHFAYPSLKPLGSWIQDLKLRIQQFQVWCSTVDPPEKFWLPGFTSPKSILNAALLTTVKNSDMMFKDLEWEYHVSTLDEAHIKEAPLEGVYIRGLFLEGAGWDKTNSLLTDPEPLHLSVAMPVIHFKPVIESSMRGLYTCPCYYTSNRTNDKGSSYLFDIKLKTKKSEEYWIKRGTAIILSNND